MRATLVFRNYSRKTCSCVSFYKEERLLAKIMQNKLRKRKCPGLCPVQEKKKEKERKKERVENVFKRVRPV